MKKELTASQALLADFMSAISERCYSAEWMQYLEYVLWDAVNRGERTYGHGVISKSDIKALQELSEKASAWIIYDDQREEIAIELKIWQKKFLADTESKPEILIG